MQFINTHILLPPRLRPRLNSTHAQLPPFLVPLHGTRGIDSAGRVFGAKEHEAPFWWNHLHHVEQEGRDVVDILAGFDVEGGLVGGVAGEEGAGWVKIDFYDRKLSVLLRDLGVEKGR